MESIKESIIDSGTFKYIQILLKDKKDPGKQRIVIRGYTNCAYHPDILDQFVGQELE